MRLCVVGPGAVGGNLATRLARSGAQVSVLARGETLRAVRERGIRVEAGGESFDARMRASDDPAELGVQDGVFVTVKAPALASVARSLEPLLEERTPVVFAVNGIPWWYHLELAARGHPARAKLDPDGALLSAVGLGRTVGCAVYSSNEVLSPGVVRNQAAAGNRLVLGELDGSSSERCTTLNGALQAAGFEAPVVADIRGEVWKKLLFNMAVASLCALSGSTMEQLARNPELRALCLAILGEGRAIAAAQGVRIEATPERMLERPMPAHKPSLLQDLEAKRAMEVDAILAAPLDFARASGVPAPVFESVATLLLQRARTAGLYAG
jgi:2-dehydropantoate 2-reductase